MDKQIQRILKNRLVSGSLALFLGGLVANFGNYLFHFFMGRFLGPEKYAVLASLTSLLYLGSVPSSAITLTSAKFSSSLKAKGELDRVKFFLLKSSQFFFFIGLGIFLLFTFGQREFAQFLNIENPSFFVYLGGIFLFMFLVAVNNGVLQGFQKFSFISLNSILGSVVKLAVGLILVWKGFGVQGALLGFLLSGLFPYFFSFYPLRFLFSLEKEEIKEKELLRKIIAFALPAFLATLGLTLFFTMDVVLVKHFFSEYQSGLYSVASLVAKVILFASSPIISVMFPLVSEKHTKNENFTRLFFHAFCLILLVSGTLMGFYLLFPKLVLLVFFGHKFLEAAPLLRRFSVFIFLYTLASAFVSFFLSTHQTKVVLFPLGGSLLQMVLIWFYHPSLLGVINVSILASFLLLLSLLFFYKMVRRER